MALKPGRASQSPLSLDPLLLNSNPEGSGANIVLSLKTRRLGLEVGGLGCCFACSQLRFSLWYHMQFPKPARSILEGRPREHPEHYQVWPINPTRATKMKDYSRSSLNMQFRIRNVIFQRPSMFCLHLASFWKRVLSVNLWHISVFISWVGYFLVDISCLQSSTRNYCSYPATENSPHLCNRFMEWMPRSKLFRQRVSVFVT